MLVVANGDAPFLVRHANAFHESKDEVVSLHLGIELIDIFDDASGFFVDINSENIERLVDVERRSDRLHVDSNERFHGELPLDAGVL